MNATTASSIVRDAVGSALDDGHIAYETQFRRAVASHLARHGIHRSIPDFNLQAAVAGAIKHRRAEWAGRVEKALRECELEYGVALVGLVDELIEEALDKPGAHALGGYVTRVRRALNERRADTYTDAENTLWRVLYWAGYRYDEASDVVYDEMHRRAVVRVKLAQRITKAAQRRRMRLSNSSKKRVPYRLAA